MRIKSVPEYQSKLVLFTVAIMALGFVFGWWVVLLVGAFIGWREKTLPLAFKLSFVCCFIAWLLLSIGFDTLSGFRISMRIGGLGKIPFPIVASLLASVVGALACSFASLTANQLRALLSIMRS